VSVVPLPRPEDPPPAEPVVDEGWALLEGLRRRLDDQSTQTRKTQQQVTQLTESIAALVDQQRQRTRRINLNSFVAYLIFTVLCLVGFYILYNSRANELVEARDHAVKERDGAVKRADELTAKVTARDEADTKAWEIYQLLEAGKRTEASRQLAAIHNLKLSRTERAVLAARAHETQVMEIDIAIKNAQASFKTGRYQDVIKPLEAALASEPHGSRAAHMRYYLGIAYAKAGTLDTAVSYLQAAVDADVEHDDARFQLASALDRNGAWGKARIQYDKFATAFPQSQFAVFAMRRSATLARLPPTAPPAAKPDVPVDPAAPKPDAPKPEAPKPVAPKVEAAKPAAPAAPAPAKEPAPVEPAPAQ
jgi:tetratricopeptide (TPR) repeat protein